MKLLWFIYEVSVACLKGSLYKGLLTAEGMQPVPMLGAGAELCRSQCDVLFNPAIASEGTCGDGSLLRGSSVLCFAGRIHLLGGAGRVTAEAVSAQQSLLLPFFYTLMS